MTQFDAPDFTRAANAVQVNTIAYIDPLAPPAPRSIPIGNLGGAASIAIGIHISHGGTSPYVSVVLQWQTSGRVTYTEAFSISNLDSGSASDIAIQLPCRGDSATMVLDGPATGPALQVTVMASSRTVPVPVVSTTAEDFPLAPLVLNAVNVGAGATISRSIGPFARGASFSMNATSALVSAVILTPIWTGSVWELIPIVSVTAVANANVTVTIPTPFRVLVVQITNTDAVSRQVTGIMTELAA